MRSITELETKVRAFVRERDWEQFHNPKDLAMGLSIEAAELLECFLWTPTEHADSRATEIRDRVTEELGDVFLFCLMLADRIGVDLVEVGMTKLLQNEARYPAGKARGRAKKYSEL